MPFEPRIYDKQPEPEPVWDDAEQLELPDDLMMLAEQLRDDATYLAAQHPADATPAQRQAAWEAHVKGEQSEVRRQRGRHGRWISAAAAVLITVTGAAWALYLLGGSNETPPTLAVTGHDVETTEAASHHPTIRRQFIVGESSTPRDGSEHRETYPLNNELPSDAPRLIPATFLRDVSPPELEGVLDLLEGEESGLSI